MLFNILFLIMIVTAGLVCNVYLVNSAKLQKIEHDLDNTGNFDWAIYHVEPEVAADIRSDRIGVEGCGVYYELGYAASGTETFYSIAAFDSPESEHIFHLSCIKGHYPANADEIAIDVTTAYGWGINPLPGETVNVRLYDNDRNFVEERQFTISGIFENKNDSQDGLPYNRYPDQLYFDTNVIYEAPTVFLSSSYIGEFPPSSYVSAFIQDNDVEAGYDLADELNAKYQIEPWKISRQWGRCYAYEEALGITLVSQEDNMDEVWGNYEKGVYYADFLTGRIIPAVGTLIAIIAALALFGMVARVLAERKKELRTLYQLGVDFFTIAKMFVCEMLVIAISGIAVGCIIGTGIYGIMLLVQKYILNLRIYPAFHMEAYLKAVTWNPYLFSACTVFFVICIISVIGIMICRKNVLNIKKRMRHFRKTKNGTEKAVRRGWGRLVRDRILKPDICITVIISIMMLITLYTFLYFEQKSKYLSSEQLYYLENNNLVGCDFSATARLPMAWYDVETQHDTGISVSSVNRILDSGYVKSYYASAVDNSTKLVYSGQDTEQLEFLQEYDIRDFAPSEKEYENTRYESQEASLNSIGFASDEAVFRVSTIGLTDDELSLLSDYIQAGEINPEKIKNGEDVVVVVAENRKKDAEGVFTVGDRLPLCDIVLSEEEDSINFEMLADIEDYLVYEKHVKDNAGNLVRYIGLAVGKRRNINPRIGAIAAVDDDFVHTYIGDNTEGSSVWIFTSVSAFSKWNVNTRNFTTFRVDVPDQEIHDFSSVWYGTLKEDSGLDMNSNFYLLEKVSMNRKGQMCIFAMMVINLIISGSIALYYIMNLRLNQQKRNLSLLRALGAGQKDLRRLLILQNIYYPFEGIVVAVLGVSFIQFICNKIQQQIPTSFWPDDEYPPLWQLNMEFYDYFSGHWIAAVVVITLTGLLLMILTTIWQYHQMKQDNIIINIQNANF